MKWINFLQRLLQRFFPKKNEIIEVKYIERDETRVLPDIPENVIAACQTLQVKLDSVKEGANKRGNSSRLTQSFHFFMFEPIFSPVNALNQPI